jgi:uncharacterized protein YbjT (DUF2867 family)
MNIAVIGGTGTVGVPMMRALLARGAAVRAYVRDSAKAHQLLSTSDGTGSLDVVPGRLEDAAGVEAALSGVDVAFIALDPKGRQGDLQRQVIEAAGRVKLPHLVRSRPARTSGSPTTSSGSPVPRPGSSACSCTNTATRSCSDLQLKVNHFLHAGRTGVRPRL